MDFTEGTIQEKHIRAKKMMLWFGIVSLIMSFAGWTSAFVVSRTREDWLSDFQLPKAFIVSTVIVMVSSVTFILANRALKNNKREQTTIWLFVTLALGIAFISNQFIGFNQIIDMGYYFTGPASNVTMSYVYLIAMVHILHVVGGLIWIFIVIYNHFKQKYSADNKLGLELAGTFWHFIDILWIYLFLFLNFVG